MSCLSSNIPVLPPGEREDIIFLWKTMLEAGLGPRPYHDEASETSGISLSVSTKDIAPAVGMMIMRFWPDILAGMGNDIGIINTH